MSAAYGLEPWRDSETLRTAGFFCISLGRIGRLRIRLVKSKTGFRMHGGLHVRRARASEPGTRQVFLVNRLGS